MQDRKFVCPCYRHERDIAATGHCICHLFVNDDYQAPEAGAPGAGAAEGDWPPITVYGAAWCQDTRRTLAFLNRRGIPYKLIDVEEDARAAARVQEWNRGYLSTPTLDVDGRIVAEPEDDELAAILGMDG